MRNLFLFIFAISILSSCKTNSVKTNEPSINWISLEEAQEKIKTSPRKIIVDVYATWCGPCKRMAKYTFTDPKVVSYINEKFYAVKFNAERTDTVSFLGKQYTNPSRTHNLSMVLGSNNGQLSYPTIAYFDESFRRLAAIPGAYPADDFLVNTKFFGENIYKEKTMQNYLQSLENQY